MEGVRTLVTRPVAKWAVDTGVAVLLFLMMSLVAGGFHEQQWRWFDGWAYLLTAAICLPLAARRRAPLLVLVLISAAYLVYLDGGYLPGLHLWGPVLALYSVAAMKPPRISLAAVAVAGPVLYAGAATLRIPPVGATVQTVVICGVAVVLGGLSRQLAQRNRQLAEATEELRREHEQQLERAMVSERLRIARELHDVIAHHMSVISMQAGLAAYVFDSDPATARTAVDTVGDISRESLDDMRRVLDLLRLPENSGEVEFTSAPGLKELPELAERVRGLGVTVDLTLTGPFDDLPSGLQLTVYRVVQEAMTNVLKHAGAVRATVTVRREPDRIVAKVANGAPAVAATGAGHGYGLLGMRERARLYGGRLTAGACPDGGFTVELVLPTM
ncbi:Signal transduction histidine kinase [Amycolatopsis xylanica]|uniref:histidine kinase n=1 Tax=Amycolatopsis xylanica TaxID=589385 RepID=A0A1H2W8H0_9PSEU|nr:sensor histidine kinase [Amycolatopsis xylanica]SDW76942.1 Signal transduction histidine kinase [Amycolatopsis xylanica]